MLQLCAFGAMVFFLVVSGWRWNKEAVARQNEGQFRGRVEGRQETAQESLNDIGRGQEGIAGDVRDIKEQLRKADEKNQKSLNEKYPYGYVLFGPSDDGLEHYHNTKSLNGISFEFDVEWLQSSYYYAEGLAHLDLRGIDFHVKNGLNVGGFSPPTQTIPLTKGKTKPLNMLIGGGVGCVLEVIDDDVRKPVFAFGFTAEPGGDPNVGIRIK